ncbi:hypothetical protein GCM10011610_04140 [Nocardia rhizosphaerihabitans]|uniref:Uncharacterized protein n=1 Tax=Nocardia rhizosphaerihabitans TaxID=1691570 RepID=A0ABQ2K8J8_9NOCA|nr:hypothetical protein GCM10011610_04140 [Nocardia rhizosphaerihabitans]
MPHRIPAATSASRPPQAGADTERETDIREFAPATEGVGVAEARCEQLPSRHGPSTPERLAYLPGDGRYGRSAHLAQEAGGGVERKH